MIFRKIPSLGPLHKLLLLATLCPVASCQQAPASPNIVLILADDLGYGDPQVYNPASKIPTPNIDQLAAAGMRFTDAHTPSSVCTPTRYGILTGRYAWRTQLKSSVLWPWDPPLIDSSRLTLPGLLRDKGYQTACIGKWHLGWRWPAVSGVGFMNDTIPAGQYHYPGRLDLWEEIDFTRPLGGGPLKAGFDYYFGDDVPNFPPYAFFENDRLMSSPDRPKPDSLFGSRGPMSEGWDLPGVMPKITRRAVRYIEERSNDKSPFFLYFALTAPHTPIAPTAEFIGKSGAGRYGDFVHEVDWAVGQVVEALRSTGAYENTWIIFTSDNGSPQRDGANMNGPIGSVKKYGHDPSRPWRGMKGDIWEGGHRVPFITAWPSRIPANTTSDQMICLTDIMATAAGFLESEIPEGQVEDSRDFSRVMTGDHPGGPLRESLVHHSHHGTFALRRAEWKLIFGKTAGGFSDNLNIPGIPVRTPGQLYNLALDPGEQNNLYADRPTIVRELSQLMKSQFSKQPFIRYATDDGAWCWFSDPRAIYTGREILTGWVKEDGTIETMKIDPVGNHRSATVLYPELEADDHDNPAFVKAADGSILAAYTTHSGKDGFFLNRTNRQADLQSFGKPKKIPLLDPDELQEFPKVHVTYANPYRLSAENNRLYCFGRWTGYKPNVMWSDDHGETWTKSKVFITNRPFDANNRPYVKYYSDGKSRIHMTFTDGHPRVEPTNSVYYAYYENGAFHGADGRRIIGMAEAPFEPHQADIVFRSSEELGRAWIADIAQDPNGNPVILYTRSPTEKDHRYHYAYYDGQEWQDFEICRAGKWFPQTRPGTTERETHYFGNMSLNPANTKVVYLSREIEGTFEIERVETRDGGNSWERAFVTENSPFDNVRPYVPRYGDGSMEVVLWMENQRYVHYTDYRTSIKYYVHQRPEYFVTEEKRGMTEVN